MNDERGSVRTHGVPLDEAEARQLAELAQKQGSIIDLAALNRLTIDRPVLSPSDLLKLAEKSK